MNKPTRIILVDKTYGTDITILIMPTQQWTTYFKEKYDTVFERDFIGFHGSHVSLEHEKNNTIKHFILISSWNWTCYEMALLAHELLHCCLSVFRDAKIPVSKDTEEPLCYYHTALLTQAYKKLRKVPKKKRGTK